MERYILQQSQSAPNRWVLTDTQEGVVITFEKNHFNDSQKVTFLDDVNAEAVEIATILRKMTDWLVEEHPDLVADEKRREVRKGIGAALKRMREEQGITVRQLSELSGLPISQLSRIENGRANPTLDSITTIATCLGLRVEIRDSSEL